MKSCLICLLFLISCNSPAIVKQNQDTNLPQNTLSPQQVQKSKHFISVNGNKFVDNTGKTIIFQGLNIADPDKLARNNNWTKRHFEVIKDWGANIIRLPIHPKAWRERGIENYLQLIDSAVTWATELDLYLIIDWHSIGNLSTNLYQHPRYNTTKEETYLFWKTIATRYKENPVIAFYEIFNEPTTHNGTLGELSWEDWKSINEEIIDIIYAIDKKVIPLVAGFDWAYKLDQVIAAPIERAGVGYVSHPYPQKVKPPYEAKWEKDFGHVADTYPVICTELGFMSADMPGAHIPTIADEAYGADVVNYFNKKGISFTAWVFDPDWSPQMISDWDYTPTNSGAFFRKVMRKDFIYSKRLRN